MAADDQAALKHGRRTVASALLEMCSAPGSTAVAPGMPAMTGRDAAERIRRLIASPPAQPDRLTRALTLTATAFVLTLPLVIAVAPAVLLANTAHLPGAG